MMNSIFKIVALSGFKRSGKDTTFNIISAKTDSNKIELARRLKSVCETAFDLKKGIFDDDAIKEKEVIYVVITIAKINRVCKEFGVKEILGLNEAQMSKLVRKAAKKVRGMVIKTPRKLAQLVGTEVLRTFHDDIHLIAAEKSMVENKLNIVTDCRFANEVEFFKKKFNAKVLFIQNNKMEAHAAKERDMGTLHKSELQMFDIKKNADVIIYNNDSIESLELYITKNILPKVA